MSAAGSSGSGRGRGSQAATVGDQKESKESKPNPKMSKALGTSAKRIQKELAEITLDPPPNCSAGPKGENFYEWVSTILGPPGSVYEGECVLEIATIFFVITKALLPEVNLWFLLRFCRNSIS